MKCKQCGREIPEAAIFCCWCGVKQLRERRKKDAIKVPKPRQLRSGAWNIELRAEGQSITEATAELCEAKARAIRAGFIEAKKAAPKMTVDAALEAYIKSRELLSPSTLRGYEAIRRTRFKAISNKDINAVDWQNAINAEAKLCSPKTLKNAWGLFSSALKSAGVEPGEVTLAQVASKELPWLDYEQIKTFLEAVKYEPCELGALLALHSLRRSEIYALTAANVDLAKGLIRVEGAAVLDADNNLTQKDTNKNQTSRRTVPIMIPTLREMLPEAITAAGDGALVQGSLNTLYVRINRVCDAAGLPRVGVQGLRRSFASLAYHLRWSELETMRVGGWSDYKTMRKIYTKLAERDKSAAVQKMEQYYSAEEQGDEAEKRS